MATVDEITEAFKKTYHSGLPFPPAKDQIPERLSAWLEFLDDVPGDTLRIAIRGIVTTAERFPSVRDVLDEAYRVRSRNGRGRSTGFEQYQAPLYGRAGSIFPPNVEAEIQALADCLAEEGELTEEGYRLMTDAEHERIDALTAPYLAAALPYRPMARKEARA